MCPPALYCCVRLCLAILYVRLPALGCCGRLCLGILCLPALSSSFDFEKHKLFGVYGGVISQVSLLVSAPFRWLCSISIHLSPRSAGVRPFLLAMWHFYSCVSQVCHCWCPPFSAGNVAFPFICLPALSLLVSACSAGHVAFLFICLPGLSLLVSAPLFPLAM